MRGREALAIATAGDVEVTAKVCARLEPEPDKATRAIQHASPYDKPYWHVERARQGESRSVRLELIVNGFAVDHTDIVADGSVQPVRFQMAITKSSWLALRIYPSSHTNPIFIETRGELVRASQESAAWCRRGVDVCWEQKRQRIRPQELEAAAAAYQHARGAYDRILADAAEQERRSR